MAAKYFCKVVEFIPAKEKASLVVVPKGSQDPRPDQNWAVLKKSKGGGIISVAIGTNVVKRGDKLKIVERADGRVMLLSR